MNNLTSMPFDPTLGFGSEEATPPSPRVVQHYVLFDRIEVQDANGISSPITYGFPAVTGFLGAIHALSRDIELAHESVVGAYSDSRLPQDIVENIGLTGVLIACHDYKLHHFRPHRYADYTFNQTRNPLKKDGSTAAIVEQGRINLTMSLVVEVASSGRASHWLNSDQNQRVFAELLHTRLQQRRIAGGSVTGLRETKLFSTGQEQAIQKKLLPGFILDEAKGELEDMTQKLRASHPEATPFDALIDLITLHHIPPADREDEGGSDKKEKKWTVKTSRQKRGWLVPMPLGYQSISPEFEPGTLENASYPQYPGQYVETIYGLGRWVFPNKIKKLKNHFWRYQTLEPDPENHPGYRLYLTTQSSK